MIDCTELATALVAVSSPLEDVISPTERGWMPGVLHWMRGSGLQEAGAHWICSPQGLCASSFKLQSSVLVSVFSLQVEMA